MEMFKGGGVSVSSVHCQGSRVVAFQLVFV